jgi:hypothetical protein
MDSKGQAQGCSADYQEAVGSWKKGKPKVVNLSFHQLSFSYTKNWLFMFRVTNWHSSSFSLEVSSVLSGSMFVKWTETSMQCKIDIFSYWLSWMLLLGGSKYKFLVIPYTSGLKFSRFQMGSETHTMTCTQHVP